MKKRIVAFLLTLAMLVGLVPQMMLAALADELAAAYTLENDFIRQFFRFLQEDAGTEIEIHSNNWGYPNETV